ncbi:MAG: hypothetical protein HC892_01470 [Saprospiraceae bacterium]|nr:hypothetical protein [Saprospiraceae bacterium]
MAKANGILNISANFNKQFADVFSSENRVDLLADLTTVGTFGAYAYAGQLTTVSADTETNNGLYRLKALPHTDINNWSKVPSQSDLATINSQLNSLQSLAYAGLVLP